MTSLEQFQWQPLKYQEHLFYTVPKITLQDTPIFLLLLYMIKLAMKLITTLSFFYIK